MLPESIQKKVKLLEIRTRKLVDNIFVGEYHTAFKGQGMTFSDFREYVPGDDVRSISWPLMARTGKPYIKKFDEERELTMMLLVDISGSADFGSGNYFKGEVMTHLAALLSFSAVKNKDQVGLLLFSDQVEHFVPPAKGQGHVRRLLRDLYYFQPKSHGTRLSSAFQYLPGILKKRAVIFVISDFFDKGFDRSLRALARKHEVVALVVNDKMEQLIPDMGVVDIQDAETGELISVDTGTYQFRQYWNKNQREDLLLRDKLLQQSQVDRVDINSSDEFVDPLIRYFESRHRRR